MPDLTTIPQAHQSIMGMTMHRDKLITVVDLVKRFPEHHRNVNTKETNEEAPDHLMVVTFGEHIVGLGISGIQNIVKKSEDEMKPYPYAESTCYPNLIKAVIEFDDKLVSVFETDVLFKSLLPPEVFDNH